MMAKLPWKLLSEMYGFMGNSLLKPMTMTATVGLDPAFWGSVPTFDDERVGSCVDACMRYAEAAENASAAGENPVERCAVEYTRLFVGPPSPAAAPWETMYRTQGATVGFGQATFEMRELLRAAGLELRNENNQYEDHLGIELLYLSELCRRAAAGQDAAVDGAAKSGEGVSVEPGESAMMLSFLDEHPLSWIAPFGQNVAEAAPGGYFDGLVQLASAVLAWHRAQLAD